MTKRDMLHQRKDRPKQDRSPSAIPAARCHADLPKRWMRELFSIRERPMTDADIAKERLISIDPMIVRGVVTLRASIAPCEHGPAFGPRGKGETGAVPGHGPAHGSHGPTTITGPLGNGSQPSRASRDQEGLLTDPLRQLPMRGLRRYRAGAGRNALSGNVLQCAIRQCHRRPDDRHRPD